MAEVVTLVTGRIPAERVDEVTDPNRQALKDRPPPHPRRHSYCAAKARRSGS
jgi:hypothetical protein